MNKYQEVILDIVGREIKVGDLVHYGLGYENRQTLGMDLEDYYGEVFELGEDGLYNVGYYEHSSFTDSIDKEMIDYINSDYVIVFKEGESPKECWERVRKFIQEKENE